jgi:hypothetical protein
MVVACANISIEAAGAAGAVSARVPPAIPTLETATTTNANIPHSPDDALILARRAAIQI